MERLAGLSDTVVMKVCMTTTIVFLTTTACASGATHDAPHEHGQHGGHHGDMPHRFDDAEKWAAVFDAPERDAWQKPDEVVKRVVTRDDLTLVDLGAGTGYFSVRFARALPRGRVIAVDVEPTLLAHVAGRAAHEGLANLDTSLAPMDGPGDRVAGDLAGRVDVVFVCDTYHHIGERTAYFAKVAAALAPGGRVVIVDFRLEAERGPPPEHRLGPDVVVNELAAAGLRLVGREDFLPDQYLLVFERAPSDGR